MGTVIKAAESNIGAFCSPVVDFQLLEFCHQPQVSTVEVVEIVQVEPEKSEAELELEKARAEAEIILKTARSEVRCIYDRATEEGYQAGLAQAQMEAQQYREDLTDQVDQLISRLESNIADAAQDRLDVLDAVEPAVLKLVLDSVQKVIRHEIKTDPRVVIRNIKACLKRIKDVNEVTVRVSPQEIAFVKEQRDELASCSECVHGVAIVDDRRVSPGGCIIESTSGDFDAKIETQFEKIRNKIMEIATDADNSNAGS